jgi:hypothetical protein
MESQQRLISALQEICRAEGRPDAGAGLEDWIPKELEEYEIDHSAGHIWLAEMFEALLRGGTSSWVNPSLTRPDVLNGCSFVAELVEVIPTRGEREEVDWTLHFPGLGRICTIDMYVDISYRITDS